MSAEKEFLRKADFLERLEERTIEAITEVFNEDANLADLDGVLIFPVREDCAQCDDDEGVEILSENAELESRFDYLAKINRRVNEVFDEFFEEIENEFREKAVAEREISSQCD